MSSRRSPLSLQKKVSVTLIAVMAVLALLSYAILDEVVAPAFDRLDVEAARTNLVRSRKAIRAELNSLGGVSNDYAVWDDAHQYLTDGNASFEKSNLDISTLNDLELDLMAYFTTDGALKWGRVAVEGSAATNDVEPLFAADAALRARLTQHRAPASNVRGIIGTPYGAMLVSSRPVVKTDESGPIAGTLVMGKFLDAGLLQSLRERTEVDMSWHLAALSAGVHAGEVESVPAAEADAIEQVIGAENINTYGLIRDIYDAPLLVLHATTPRQISALGHRTLDGAILLLAIAAIIIAIVTWLLLRTMIVRPLESVTAHITAIRESGDLSRRLDMGRADEIGAVAGQFDQMTDELDDARQSLLEQSFKAGKADTAAEVLHNIRNAMTPLINGVDRLGMVCSVTNGLKVDQALEQLSDSTCDADRRVKLLQYIDSAFKHVEASHAEGDRELKAVSRQARQVEAILSDQERHAVGAPVLENLELDEMLDEAVLVIPKRRRPAVELELAGELGRFRVKGHRVGLLQVLSNLVLNAYESIQRSNADSGRISLSAVNEKVGERDMVRVVVSDTGCGFDSERRKKIFQRGFSSKEGKMGGLGLHWCANALAAMGGRITAESMGEGQGAQFHVLLPAGHGG